MPFDRSGIEGGTDSRVPPAVRRARSGDATVLSRLQSQLRESSPDLLEYGLAVGDVFVATERADPDTPVGYLLPVSGDEGFHIAELVVASSHRREGYATALLRASLATTTGPVTLLVASDNEPALALYDELDFDRVGRRPDVYDDGEAVLLRRE